NPRSTHEHKAVNAILVLCGYGETESAAKGIANKMSLFDIQGIHETNHESNPIVEIVFKVFRVLCITKADNVRREHMKLFREHRNQQAPVGITCHPGAGAVNQDNRVTCSLLLIINTVAIHFDVFAKLRIIAHIFLRIYSAACGGARLLGLGLTNNVLFSTFVAKVISGVRQGSVSAAPVRTSKVPWCQPHSSTWPLS